MIWPSENTTKSSFTVRDPAPLRSSKVYPGVSSVLAFRLNGCICSSYHILIAMRPNFLELSNFDSDTPTGLRLEAVIPSKFY